MTRQIFCWGLGGVWEASQIPGVAVAPLAPPHPWPLCTPGMVTGVIAEPSFNIVVLRICTTSSGAAKYWKPGWNCQAEGLITVADGSGSALFSDGSPSSLLVDFKIGMSHYLMLWLGLILYSCVHLEVCLVHPTKLTKLKLGSAAQIWIKILLCMHSPPKPCKQTLMCKIYGVPLLNLTTLL